MNKSSLIKSVAVAALCCSLHATCIAGPEQVSEAFGEISRLIATSRNHDNEPHSK